MASTWPNVLLLLLLSCLVILTLAQNKYSKEANEENMYTKKHPFRMQKLNIIWEKAKTVKRWHLYLSLSNLIWCLNCPHRNLMEKR